MAFKQIAFDFGDLPQKPKPENILIPEEQVMPAVEIVPEVEPLAELEEIAETQVLAEENVFVEASLLIDVEGLTDEVVAIEMEVVEAKIPLLQKEPSTKKTPAIQQAVQNIPEKVKSTRGRKSVKEMSEGVALIDVPADDILFQKMYYTIGKVAEMFKVNQSLIRLWENEFDVLKPKKNGKGDRLFRPEDIKNIQLIYHLMRERKYTMEGAKDFIKNNKKASEKFSTIESLKKLKGFLIEMKANL